MDVSARGETVLAELRLLVALSTEQSRSQADSFKTQTNTAFSRHDIFSDTVTGGPSPPRSISVRFPATRISQASSTAKGYHLEGTDENVFQNRSSLGIARTVRRTLSGGLSNILRPFQPPIMKNNSESCKIEVQPQPNGFHKIRRKVSSNFTRKVNEEVTKRAPAKEHRGQKRRHTTVATATGSKPQSARNRKARESVCSRNSTISVLEYLAARRVQEEPGQDENLVPLSEYGRNCHLYGCDSPHIWNPDKNSSCPIIHCECDNDDRSKMHIHIDETPFFYKPGGSTSTVTQSMAAYTSSVLANLSRDSLCSPQRPPNPVPPLRNSSSLLF